MKFMLEDLVGRPKRRKAEQKFGFVTKSGRILEVEDMANKYKENASWWYKGDGFEAAEPDEELRLGKDFQTILVFEL